MWHSPLRLARSIQGGSRPAWGWNFGGGVARSVRPLKLMDQSWISDPSKPCDVSICISKKSTKKTIKNDQKLSKLIKKRSKIIKNSFFKPENGQVVNFAPENRPSCATDQQAVSQWRQLITRASGGDEVGKERKALEQLPKVLQTQWGTDELIRGIIPKWPNLKKVYESLWLIKIYRDYRVGKHLADSDSLKRLKLCPPFKSRKCFQKDWTRGGTFLFIKQCENSELGHGVLREWWKNHLQRCATWAWLKESGLTSHRFSSVELSVNHWICLAMFGYNVVPTRWCPQDS